MSEYNAGNIKVLKGLEGVRLRPTMYIGDLSTAVYQMLIEIFDNAIDEASAGYCNQIDIYINNDGSYTVVDNGRGIPVDVIESEGKPAIEVILSTLHAGGKFGSGGYKYSSGLHGVGASVTNALSSNFTAEVYRNGKVYQVIFEKGIVTHPLIITGETTQKGTKITFTPDASIIENLSIDYNRLVNRLTEIQYLIPGLKINLYKDDSKKEFYSLEGLKELVKNNITKPVTSLLDFKSDNVQVCLQWSSEDVEKFICFTNNVRQLDGGTHLMGVRAGLWKCIQDYIKLNYDKIKVEVISDDLKKGLVGSVLVFLENPEFASQTKEKLVASEARRITDKFVIERFSKWLEENPTEARQVIQRIFIAADERRRLAEARESIKKLSFEIPIGKVIDVRTNENTELFIVEGKSAGGPLKANLEMNQGVFTIRGKILNVERSSLKKISEVEEIRDLFITLGIGFGEFYNYKKLRYDRIIIMTDADIDGHHIKCLLVTMFVKLAPELIMDGKIYISKPPLFKVWKGNDKGVYLQDKADFDNYLYKYIIGHHKLKVNGNIIGENDLRELVRQCYVYQEFFNHNKIVGIEPRIMSLIFIYGKNAVKYIETEMKAVCEMIDENNGYKLKIRSVYGNLEYFIDGSIKNIDNDYFPFYYDEELILEPLQFLDIFERKAIRGLNIQRYKGLGEMNDDQLWETCINEENRILQQIIVSPERMQEVTAFIERIMGDSTDRTNFILDNVNRMLNLNLDI
jgi:DNA gyrase subunit B